MPRKDNDATGKQILRTYQNKPGGGYVLGDVPLKENAIKAGAKQTHNGKGPPKPPPRAKFK